MGAFFWGRIFKNNKKGKENFMNKTNLFGNSNQQVSRIGLGCMGMSGTYGAAHDETSIQTIQRALDLGCNFIDTADVYGFGHNEELVGQAIKNHRTNVFLASKCGLSSPTKNMSNLVIKGTPDYIYEACNNSLKRLNVDVIDLYYLHRLDPNVAVEESVGALSRLVEQGKIKHIGLSEVSSQTLMRAHSTHPITALQSEYSLWWREPEDNILDTCKKLNVAFVPFSPLGRAMLTGKITDTKFEEKDIRNFFSRFEQNAFDHNLQLINELKQFAAIKNITMAQLSLSWLLHQGDFIFPIPGTKRISYLEENWASIDASLSQQDLEFMNSIFDASQVIGSRYPGSVAKLVDRS